MIFVPRYIVNEQNKKPSIILKLYRIKQYSSTIIRLNIGSRFLVLRRDIINLFSQDMTTSNDAKIITFCVARSA